MPLLCHTVAEHGWLIVKSSAPFRESEKDGRDDQGVDGDGEVEEVDEERGASRSGKYSCWKDEEKNNNNRTDRRTMQTVSNDSTQKAG